MRVYEYMINYKTKDGNGYEMYRLPYRLTTITVREIEKMIEAEQKRKTVVTNIQLLCVRGA